MAYALNTAFAPERKAGKLPADTRSRSHSLAYGEASLEVNRDAFKPSSKDLLEDNLIATGGTLGAALDRIEELQGDLVEVAALASIGALPGEALLTGARCGHLFLAQILMNRFSEKARQLDFNFQRQTLL